MTDVVATPEWAIARRGDVDVLGGNTLASAWTARVVNATRGVPHTDFGHRHIAVPAGDHPTAKVVRAHELVHATISPMTLDPMIMASMGLSHQSIALAEELRVNQVLSRRAGQLGVDMKAMKDGTELRDARMAVASNNYEQVLGLVCSTMFTGSERAVATEIQREFPQFRDIRRRIKNYLTRVGNWTLTDTAPSSEYRYLAHEENGDVVERSVTLPMGFGDVTLPLAQFIESLLPGKNGQGQGANFRQTLDEAAQTPLGNDRGWAALRFGLVPLRGNGLGFLSRTKRASSVGRSPRRLHRLLTDPERRVFDRVSRKRGGVVLVDGSGSMSLSSDDLKEIVQAAPGCRVAVYSYESGRPNIWVVADKGQYALEDDFPSIGADNCVDLPALAWAVRQRVDHRDPVVWVSDGGVTGVGCGFTESLARQTITHNRKHKVIQVEDTAKAVELLRDLARGGTPTYEPKGLLRHYVKAGSTIADDE